MAIQMQASADAKAGPTDRRDEVPWSDPSKVHERGILKVDVNCTPISALDELLRQLDGPCMPTFKLKDLPQSVRDDLYSIASPNFESQGDVQWPTASSATKPAEPNKETKKTAPRAAMMKARTQSMPLPQCQPEKPHTEKDSVPPPDSAPSMPLPESSSMPSLNDLPASSSRQFDSSETSGKSATGLSLQERRGSAPQSHQQLSTDLSIAKGKQISCLRCGTMVTPQWRSGPEGPRTMCNACGVKYRKELRDKDRQGEKRRRLES